MKKCEVLEIVIGGTLLAVGAVFLFNSCKTIPKGVTAVQSFDKDRYLGKWYEIARMDYKYEKNMDHTTACYCQNEDGTIKVVNRGYDHKKGEFDEAVGKAKFVGDPTEAKLKVSFFGPFYAGYNVIDIDEDYRYALVAGKSRKYLWILSRETTIPEEVKDKYLQKAAALGFDVDKLVWVKQD